MDLALAIALGCALACAAMACAKGVGENFSGCRAVGVSQFLFSFLMSTVFSFLIVALHKEFAISPRGEKLFERCRALNLSFLSLENLSG